MNIMTKCGSQDNVVTYEHICDTTEDLQNIDPRYINLGTIAVVLQGQEGIEFYMANSNKEWITITTGGSGGGDEEDDEEMVYEFEKTDWSYQVSEYTYWASGFKSKIDAEEIFSSIKQGKHVVFHLPDYDGYNLHEQYIAVIGFSDVEGYEFLSLANNNLDLYDSENYSNGNVAGTSLSHYLIQDGKLVLRIYDD